jgi:hypothetical protein
VIALFAALLGCVPIEQKKDAAPPRDGPRAADVAMSAPDAQASPANCQQIRNCVFRCQGDTACADRCVSSAPGPARQLYNTAQMCSRSVCAPDDIECRCAQECHGGGACTEIVDECDEAISDLFCDGPCH